MHQNLSWKRRERHNDLNVSEICPKNDCGFCKKFQKPSFGFLCSVHILSDLPRRNIGKKKIPLFH